ncbi:hypothetical protein [Alicyclobacillus vulcanalis]|uniref:Uncharacterized protein n=1 Tax=Alicyclobacillus vulcanalis TaxID=252246 RepID=A0A1N7L2F4_9BACL|nr:hypothetical protein [Alicyclobacillus vulcanalis]SIS68038.1 hypothetical protein SAMN05421799_102368 [Alicyclobacillus vulcanalis]
MVQQAVPAIFFLIVGLIAFVIGLAVYIYASIVFYRVLKKTGVSKPWAAWIPVYNSIKMLNAIGMRGWWVLVPMVIGAIGLILSPPHAYDAFRWPFIVCTTIAAIIIATWFARLFRGFGMSPVFGYFYAGVGIPVLNFICIVVVYVGLSIIAFRRDVVWWGVR